MLLLSVMVVTALLSAFVNNSATTVMMLPIATATLLAVIGADEGAELLRQRLADRVDIDFATARRLFTLICVLHIRG